MRLARTTRSHAVVFLQALDTGVVRAKSDAAGSARFFQTNLTPWSHLASLPAFFSVAGGTPCSC